MLPAYRRRQLVMASILTGLLVIPFVGFKVWRGVAALTAPSLTSLYGEWRIEPFDLGGIRVRLPIAQHLSLQPDQVSIDELPPIPARYMLNGDQLTLELDGDTLGSAALDLTVENAERLSYTIPVTGDRIYFRKASQP
ncbi:hypothetical protein LH433_13375 [Laribacter hongkongensis]|uniref:hypothetical protein n=1 Tax=Laribacter hongkongensis TaxID=168471 RepID=UPI001EFDB541|nr:hypothetical protein [Laribacter hongkongensis]MCG9107710.1 hypothetical protein [Laribacter hongkongensis]